MKKYEIIKSSREIKWKDRRDIRELCTLEDQDPETVESFTALEEAREALKKYKTSITEYHYNRTFFEVEGFYIQENEYDEEGEWIGGGDICECAPVKIEVLEKPGCKILGEFDNYKDAEDFAAEYDGENEVYISF